MKRVSVTIELRCDHVTGTDAFGDVYCRCRAKATGSSVEDTTRRVSETATAAGWLLTAAVGRDLCRLHARHANTPQFAAAFLAAKKAGAT